MIETTIPEISVSELMNRVRTRVEEMRQNRVRPNFPPVHEVGRIAAAIPPKAANPKTEQIASAIHFASKATNVSRWIPKPLRGLFRRQGKVNHQILRALDVLAGANAQMADRLRHLISCVEVQDHGIQHLADLRRADREWMNATARMLVTFSDKLDETRTEVDELRLGLKLETNEAFAHLTDRASSVERLAEQTAASLRAETAALEQKIDVAEERLAAIAEHGNQLAIEASTMKAEHNTIAESFRTLRSDFDSVGEHVRVLQTASDHVNTVTENLQRELAARGEHNKLLTDQLQGETTQRAAVLHDVASLEQRYTTDTAFIKAELSRQSAAFHKLLDRILSGKKGKLKTAADKELAQAVVHQLDAFYLSFENRFRGPREEIKRRLNFYLPFLKKARAGIRNRPVVDLGCGRGEWLELLRETNLNATGVDLNEPMLDQCKERGLDVVQSDVLDFLRGVPDNSQGGVTGFHIIEHLPFDVLVNVIAETFRILQPGGIAIFESPNCKNLSVGACYFYMDPTHRNPVFPETAQFMLESCGFERVRLEYLSPVDTTGLAHVDEEPMHLRELLYGPRDFGVIGYKSLRQ